jgi:hypothetical protein
MKVARRPPTTIYAVTIAGRFQYAAQRFIPVRGEHCAAACREGAAVDKVGDEAEEV